MANATIVERSITMRPLFLKQEHWPAHAGLVLPVNPDGALSVQEANCVRHRVTGRDRQAQMDLSVIDQRLGIRLPACGSPVAVLQRRWPQDPWALERQTSDLGADCRG